jgi:hypothetical protein
MAAEALAEPAGQRPAEPPVPARVPPLLDEADFDAAGHRLFTAAMRPARAGCWTSTAPAPASGGDARHRLSGTGRRSAAGAGRDRAVRNPRSLFLRPQVEDDRAARAAPAADAQRRGLWARGAQRLPAGRPPGLSVERPGHACAGRSAAAASSTSPPSRPAAPPAVRRRRRPARRRRRPTSAVRAALAGAAQHGLRRRARGWPGCACPMPSAPTCARATGCIRR